MKKFLTTILIVALSLLSATYIFAQLVSAQADFDAFVLSVIPTLDGSINPSEWADAGHYSNIPIDPTGIAEIWTKHDATDMYIALQFTADITAPWVAFELGTTGCMDNVADGVIFGDTNSPSYTDLRFTGEGSWGTGPIPDTTQNGAGGMQVNPTTLKVEIEFKKPLNSGDSTGNDIAWTAGNTYNLVIAWDSNGGGNLGGGSANHHSGTTPTARTILISPNPIPEFPGWMFIVVLVIAIVPVIFLARKTIPKLPTTRKF